MVNKHACDLYRLSLVFGLVILALGSAVAQQSATSRIPGRWGLLGSTGIPSTAPSDAPAAPKWSSDFAWKFNTSLENHSAVYDQANNITIFFGGIDRTVPDSVTGFDSVTNQVIVYAPGFLVRGNPWNTLIANGAAGSPLGRLSHTAVYDSANNRMIIFGGENLNNGVFQTMNDVWVLANANGQTGTPSWTQLTPSGTAPAARYLHTAIYDAANNIMTVFGGSAGLSAVTNFTDVWTLSHANGLGGTPVWTKLTPGGTLPAGSAAGSAVYDSTNNIMTVFGGINPADTVYTNGVWSLSHANGLGGTSQWTKLVGNGTPGAPGKRVGHVAAYDATNNRMIVCSGGSQTSFVWFNDVWVLTNANGLGGNPVWTKLKPLGTPPGVRAFPAAVYDSINNRLLLHGGDNIDAVYSTVWILSDANGL